MCLLIAAFFSLAVMLRPLLGGSDAASPLPQSITEGLSRGWGTGGIQGPLLSSGLAGGVHTRQLIPSFSVAFSVQTASVDFFPLLSEVVRSLRLKEICACDSANLFFPSKEILIWLTGLKYTSPLHGVTGLHAPLKGMS